MPKPGPAHEVLKMDAGVWDAVIEVTPTRCLYWSGGDTTVAPVVTDAHRQEAA